MVIQLLIYSILPVILIGTYIYIKDKNKEPKSILIKLLAQGILSTILVASLTLILSSTFEIFLKEYTQMNQIELLLYSFVCISLIEELCKFAMLYKTTNNLKENDEPYDMLLYGSFIGLGFASIENIIYVFSYGTSIAIIRAFTAVPIHAMLGILMGYFLEKYYKKRNIKNITKSLLIPVMIHGLYDYCLLNSKYFIISIITLVILLIYIIKLLKKESNKSIIIEKNNPNNYNTKEIYCPICGTKYELNFCIKCGRKRN